MNKSNQAIRGIAEISLRVHDLNTMRRFYEDVIGLDVLREYEDNEGKAVFYGVGAGDENLALFEENLISWSMRNKAPQIDPRLTTFHHLAFNIALDAFESEKKRLEGLGIEIIASGTSSWMHARMFYVVDPEGNLIEFKSHDESVR